MSEKQQMIRDVQTLAAQTNSRFLLDVAVALDNAGRAFLETNEKLDAALTANEELKVQLGNTVLDASSLIEKVLHWAEVVRRNPDVSRDELLTMIADTKQGCCIN